jgi:hypothetical protein
VPLPVDKYGDILKIVQIGFYTIAAIVAILTYLAAKRGLLNTRQHRVPEAGDGSAAEAVGRPVQRV